MHLINDKKKQIFQLIGRMPGYLKLIYGLYKDRDVPREARVFLSLAIAYNVSPIDLIPDLIPVAGQFDNVHFTLKLLRRALQACPAEVTEKHLKNACLTPDNLDQDILASEQLIKDFGRTVLKTLQKIAGAAGAAAFALFKTSKGLLRTPGAVTIKTVKPKNQPPGRA